MMLSWLWSKGHYYRTARVVILTSLFWLSLNLILLSVANSGEGGIFGRGGFDGGQRMLEMRIEAKVEKEEEPNVVKTGGGGWLREKQEKLEVSSPANNVTTTIIAAPDAAPRDFSGLQYPAAQLRRWKPSSNPERADKHPGSMGNPAKPDDEQEAKRRFREHQFNVVASDLVPLDRSLKDLRPSQCHSRSKPPASELLPSTSVIIVFHNEAWSTLLRTVHSAINRSPRELLDEILLVDDASELEHLGRELEEYVATLEVPVRVLRVGKRAGLVKARLLGASEAVAPTLTFLDAHCECTAGWLETQLAQLADDRSVVTCPVIDSIDANTFAFPGNSGGKSVGIFDWSFGFHWGQSNLNLDAGQPRPSPAMAGGLFTIDKEFFYHLGSYDENMEFWGGENVEMSLRIWRCGGSITIDPCSHVGHVFRTETPHQWPGGARERGRMISRNTVRTVEVWADEWKELYYKAHPGMRDVDFGDVSERLEIRERLQCKSMQWFLDTVFPFSAFTKDYVYIGEIKHPATGMCLDTLGKNSNVPGLYSCHRQGGSQAWMLTADGRLRNNDHCLSWHQHTNEGDVELKKVKCANSDSQWIRYQRWTFSEEGGQLRGQGQSVCLEGPAAKASGVQAELKLSKCRSGNGVKSAQAFSINSS